MEEWEDIFEYVSLDTIIRDKQEKYYDILGSRNKSGELTLFIEYI